MTNRPESRWLLVLTLALGSAGVSAVGAGLTAIGRDRNWRLGGTLSAVGAVLVAIGASGLYRRRKRSKNGIMRLRRR